MNYISRKSFIFALDDYDPSIIIIKRKLERVVNFLLEKKLNNILVTGKIQNNREKKLFFLKLPVDFFTAICAIICLDFFLFHFVKGISCRRTPKLSIDWDALFIYQVF